MVCSGFDALVASHTAAGRTVFVSGRALELLEHAGFPVTQRLVREHLPAHYVMTRHEAADVVLVRLTPR